MAYASLTDVKRVLRLADDDDARDAQLRAALDAVESWAELALGLDRFTRTGSQVETYLDVFEDATLRLPVGATVTRVKVYDYPGAVASVITPLALELGVGYDLTDSGDLVLRPNLTVSPFEGAVASRRLRTYSRVEVFYEASGVVPRAVTEGIAFLAAGYWQTGPRVLRDLRSEKIGDYSYTLGEGASGAEPSFVARALFFLQPVLRRSRVAVT